MSTNIASMCLFRAVTLSMFSVVQLSGFVLSLLLIFEKFPSHLHRSHVMCSLFSTLWAKTLKNFVYLSCINVLSCLLRLTEFSVPYVYLLRTLVKSSCLFIFVVIFLTVSADFSTSSVCMHSVPSAVLLSSSLLCKHVQVDFYGHHVIDMCWSSIVILDLFVLLMD